MTEALNIQQQIKNFGQRTKGDKVIWALVILLVLASLLVVYSATGSLAYKLYRGNTEVYLFKQITFIILGWRLFILLTVSIIRSGQKLPISYLSFQSHF
jgi:cell division protein FtsW